MAVTGEIGVGEILVMGVTGVILVTGVVGVILVTGVIAVMPVIGVIGPRHLIFAVSTPLLTSTSPLPVARSGPGPAACPAG